MTCQDCGAEIEDAADVVRLKVGRKTLKLCEDCAASRREEQDIAEDAEGAMQGMMEYKGR